MLWILQKHTNQKQHNNNHLEGKMQRKVKYENEKGEELETSITVPSHWDECTLEQQSAYMEKHIGRIQGKLIEFEGEPEEDRHPFEEPLAAAQTEAEVEDDGNGDVEEEEEETMLGDSTDEDPA